MVRKTELKNTVDLSHFSSFNIMSYFIYTDLISSLLDPRLVDPGCLLDPRLVDPGSTLINVGCIRL